MSKSALSFLSAGAAVVIRYDGVALVRGRVGPPWDVDADSRHAVDLGDLAELLALAGRPVEERLAEVESDAGRHRRTSALVDVLEAYDLLVESPGSMLPSDATISTPEVVPDPGRSLALVMPVVLAPVDGNSAPTTTTGGASPA